MTSLILGFYWFQLRPSLIKKNCSLTTKTIPATPEVTKNQAEENRIVFEKCNKEVGKSYEGLATVKCFLLKQSSITKKAQPAKIEINPATDYEYKICLRQNGLQKTIL